MNDESKREGATEQEVETSNIRLKSREFLEQRYREDSEMHRQEESSDEEDEEESGSDEEEEPEEPIKQGVKHTPGYYAKKPPGSLK
jgi:hypothetical protein